jgi:hypothetical protein
MSNRVPPLTSIPPDRSVAMQRFENATEDEAHDQGQWAYTFGIIIGHNPYFSGTMQWDWWNSGWYFAQQDDEG